MFTFGDSDLTYRFPHSGIPTDSRQWPESLSGTLRRAILYESHSRKGSSALQNMPYRCAEKAFRWCDTGFLRWWKRLSGVMKKALWGHGTGFSAKREMPSLNIKQHKRLYDKELRISQKNAISGAKLSQGRRNPVFPRFWRMPFNIPDSAFMIF